MRKSPEEREEIRRRTEAKRRPAKDRTAHIAARGKRSPSLSELSRTKPSHEELLQIFALMETESDRGCALIAGCFLENTLGMAIDCHLVDAGDELRRQLHDGSAAPLGTFAAKIKMGRALGIYDQRVQTAFETIKDVRNAFAHALRPIDFKHPAIEAAVRGLLSGRWPKEENGMAPARIRYIAFCTSMGRKLFEVAENRGGQEIEIGITL